MAKDTMIEKQFGKTNPFTVPEGYFEQLQKNVMDALPEQTPKAVAMKPQHRFLRPAIGIAASICIAVAGAAVWFANANDDQNVALLDNDEFIEMFGDTDGAAEYIMMDNEDIYAFVSEY